MLLLLFCLACEQAPDVDVFKYETDTDTDTDADTDADADTDTAPPGVEHCGDLGADTTWRAADNPHHLICTVTVLGATLTLEAGVEVEVDEGDGIDVGDREHGGSLRVEGTAEAPVSLRARVTGEAWDGLEITELADGISLSWLEVSDAGAGTHAAVSTEVPLLVDHLTVDGSGDHGLELLGAARFEAGSGAITVRGVDAAAFPLSLPATAVASLPTGAVDLADNPQALVRITGGDVTESGTWADPGVPYLLDGDLTVEGTADTPAILTIGPGTTLAADRGAGIRIAPDGGAAGLRVLGTEAAPVLLTAFGSEAPGYWDGIRAESGTLADAFTLAHTTVAWAGGSSTGAAVYVEDATLLIDALSLTGSADVGLYLDGEATLAAGSDELVVQGGLRPVRLPAPALGTFDGVSTDLLDNSDPVVQVDGGTVSTATTWPRLDVPYWVEGNIVLEGTADDPATLTLTPGTTFAMAGDTGIYVGRYGGAAALVARGTEEAPIVFRPAEAEIPGEWAGIGVYDTADDALTVFDHVDIGFAGGSTLSGNLHLVAANPTVDHTALHDGDGYGLYLDDDAAPVLGTVTYADNRLGDVGP